MSKPDRCSPPDAESAGLVRETPRQQVGDEAVRTSQWASGPQRRPPESFSPAGRETGRDSSLSEKSQERGRCKRRRALRVFKREKRQRRPAAEGEAVFPGGTNGGLCRQAGGHRAWRALLVRCGVPHAGPCAETAGPPSGRLRNPPSPRPGKGTGNGAHRRVCCGTSRR